MDHWYLIIIMRAILFYKQFHKLKGLWFFTTRFMFTSSGVYISSNQQDTAMNFNRNLCASNKVCSKAADKYFTILNHSQLNWVWDW